MKASVAIVGGGISGLAAAYRLQELRQAGAAGADHVLLESGRRLGGKIITDRVDGFTVEGGPDCFLSEKPWVFDLASRVGIDDRLLGTNEAHKGTFVLSGGRLHRLPEGLVLMIPTRIMPFLLSPLISWPGKARMALDLLLPRRPGQADESLAAFVRRRLGREALDKIAEPLVAGIHAGDPELMSLRASFPRFLQMEEKHGSLIRAMLAARKRAPAQAPAGKARNADRTYFMSFRGGMGELPDAVAKRLDPQRILTGHEVIRITGGERGNGYVIEVDGTEPVVARSVIVATSPDTAARLLAGLAPGIADNLRRIPLASTATVSLAFRREEVASSLAGFGFVIPLLEGRRIMAVTYSSIKWSYRTPDDAKYVLFRVFAGGARNRGLTGLSDADLILMVREELHSILGITAAPLFARAYRWINGMPQYTLGHLERMAALDELLREQPGLHLAGAAYRGIGIGDCINSGFTAAEKVVRVDNHA